MNLERSFRIGVTAAALCASAFASGDNNNQNAAFTSGIVGSVPNQSVAGVPSSGAPWVVRDGHAVLNRNGKLKVEVEGLLITAGTLANGNPVPAALIGTTGPVTMVAASLVCNGMVVGSTPAAPLSPAGNAEMEGRLGATMCSSPTVLVRIATSMSPATPLGPFIALSGAAMGDNGADDNGNDGAGHDAGDNHGHHN